MGLRVAPDAVELPLSLTTLYTANQTMDLTDMAFCNTTSAEVSPTIYVVPKSVTAASKHIIYNTVVLAKDSPAWHGSKLLKHGDTIQVLAGATGLNFNATMDAVQG